VALCQKKSQRTGPEFENCRYTALCLKIWFVRHRQHSVHLLTKPISSCCVYIRENMQSFSVKGGDRQSSFVFWRYQDQISMVRSDILNDPYRDSIQDLQTNIDRVSHVKPQLFNFTHILFCHSRLIISFDVTCSELPAASLKKQPYINMRGCVARACKVQFCFAVLPSSTYLFTAGVEGVYFHLITLRHTPQSVGFLWTRDRPVAETSI
jgi:hypothetical protein